MKRKIGPLPLWTWVLIAGGTLGIIWYLRSPSPSSAAPADVVLDSSLPATAGPQADLGAGGGGGTTAAAGSVTNDDIWNQLMELQSDVAVISGGQGLTDPPAETQTWAGQLADLAAAITTIQDLENKLSGSRTAKERQADKNAAAKAQEKAKAAQAAQGKKKRTPEQMRADNPAMVERVKARAKRKARNPGSGGAANTDQSDQKPIRNTSQKRAAARRREAAHQTQKAKHVGGARQDHRTKSPHG